MHLCILYLHLKLQFPSRIIFLKETSLVKYTEILQNILNFNLAKNNLLLAIILSNHNFCTLSLTQELEANIMSILCYYHI